MAESLDDGEFWLPPQFLTDDDMFMDNKMSVNNIRFNNAKDVFVSASEFPKPLFPLEFPYGFGSYGGFSSDLSSPVESVVGSAEESDEEDCISGLTCKMARSKLDDDFEGNDSTFGNESAKCGFVSGSPQSTLCGVGSGCRCRQGSSHGSPNESSKVSSPPATWDLLYAAAGEVARMRMDEEGCIFNSHNRGILGLPRKPLVSVLMKNPNPDFGFYPQQSLSYQKLQAAQFNQLRQQQMMKQQGSGVWAGQSKDAAAAFYQQQQQAQTVVQTRGRHPAGPSALSPSAWPPLQRAQQRQHRQGGSGSGMRAVFLGNPGAKRECAGTGVFLPRLSTPAETRKKPGCSTVLLPARVVQALNLKLDDMDGAQQAQFQHRLNANFIPDCDNALRFRNCNVLSHQKRSLRPLPDINATEVRLPQEWTY